MTMAAQKIGYEQAVGYLQRHIQQVVPDYDRQVAERDYEKRPDLAIVYIRRQIMAEESQDVDGCSVVSVKGKKIA